MTNFKNLEIHEKLWGRELWIHNSESYCGKILEIKQGHFSSRHFHKLKTETWLIFSGEILFEYQENEKLKSKNLLPNDVVHIECGEIHKMTAIKDSIIVEISTQHFEDDSYRIELSGKL